MNLSISIGKLKLKNPILVASGTFGYGQEFEDLVNLKNLGAIITKTITKEPKLGNPPPRLVETAAGMLNAIGLQNEGLDNFLKVKMPYLKKAGTKIIVSISGSSINNFVQLAQRLEEENIDALELNLSCPNIKRQESRVGSRRKNRNRRLQTADRGQMIAQDPKATYSIVKTVRKVTKKTLIVKLSPNVTDIVSIAQAAEKAGADAISLVNTFLGMAIEVEKRKPKLANITGGLSGPAIKPIALRMVYEVARDSKIPIIGMGGIMDTEDALEFIIAGATAVCIGTANFVNPRVSLEIIEGFKKYLKKKRIKDINQLIGSLKV